MKEFSFRDRLIDLLNAGSFPQGQPQSLGQLMAAKLVAAACSVNPSQIQLDAASLIFEILESGTAERIEQYAEPLKLPKPPPWLHETGPCVVKAPAKSTQETNPGGNFPVWMLNSGAAPPSVPTGFLKTSSDGMPYPNASSTLRVFGGEPVQEPKRIDPDSPAFDFSQFIDKEIERENMRKALAATPSIVD